MVLICLLISQHQKTTKHHLVSLSQRSIFLDHLAQTSEQPLLLEIVKASGVILHDAQGKEYMDLISGIAVSSLGHGHPEIIKAVNQQLNNFMHVMVYGELVLSPQTKFAKALTDLLPSSLNCVYLVNSGTEAIEGAMKLAKRFTGRSKIVAMRNSYHGSTQGAMSLNSNTYYTDNYKPLLPGVEFIDFNDHESLNQIDQDTACVISEVIQAEAGVIKADVEYMNALRHSCNNQGALLIFDEVQTGFYRTGKRFAFEHYDIIPDVLVLGKAMGGGMPLGAFVAPQNIMKVLSHNPVLGHITTFGGHAVCCAAALASLHVLESEKDRLMVERKSNLFVQNLKHEKIIKVDAFGLLIAITFQNAELNRLIVKKCIESGLMVDWFLFAEHKMRIAPPLIINEEQIIKACKIIVNVCNSI